jgi:hypothetical protein
LVSAAVNPYEFMFLQLIHPELYSGFLPDADPASQILQGIHGVTSAWQPGGTSRPPAACRASDRPAHMFRTCIWWTGFGGNRSGPCHWRCFGASFRSPARPEVPLTVTLTPVDCRGRNRGQSEEMTGARTSFCCRPDAGRAGGAADSGDCAGVRGDFPRNSGANLRNEPAWCA